MVSLTSLLSFLIHSMYYLLIPMPPSIYGLSKSYAWSRMKRVRKMKTGGWLL